MNIVIIGGGKVGYYLSKTLIEHGHQPSIIELNVKTCNLVANDLDIPIICGDGTSIEVLEMANVEDADVLISVTGKDEINLISCQLAKNHFNVPKVIAKVNNPKNSEVLQKLGIDITVSSTNNITRLLEREIDVTRVQELLVMGDGQATINQLILPPNYSLHAKKLSELSIPHNSVIVSIKRQGEVIIPRGDTELWSEDAVIAMSKDDGLHKLKKSLQIVDV